MNDSMRQFLNLLQSLPLSKKIGIGFTLSLVVAGFVFMIVWTNQTNYRALFNGLSPEDGSAIVSKLKERKIPYKVEGNGATIMVPAEKVYELRLEMAGDGLPNGGNIGFEIFDNTKFSTTKFVQELNYRRALQGELAKTINQFKEVKSSRVFIVLPKESLFVEETKPASASIQLDLKSSIPPNKLAAVIHLVANAVEGLEPEGVTVVDTKGRIIFKGGDRDDTTAILSNAQLEYKSSVERGIRKSIQTMLDGIVGAGKAIVRVNAMIDFNKITLNKEEYDPLATAVRSRKNIEESLKTGESTGDTGQELIDKRKGVIPPSTVAQKSETRKDETTNYEINKITEIILRPAGEIKQLSVAAVIDGTYKSEKLKDGTIKENYIPRTKKELQSFEDLVKRAMGYSEDREDQVTVSSIPFSKAATLSPESEITGKGFDILKILENYKNAVIGLFFVILIFFLAVRPVLKGLKKLESKNVPEIPELPEGEAYAQITEPEQISQREVILELTSKNPEKTEQLLKGWISEE